MNRRYILRLVISTLLLLAMFLPTSLVHGQSLIATIPVGTDPQGVAVNPLTNRIYVANHGSNDVSVIDGATNTVVATVPVGVEPQAIGVNPSTNLVYVTNQGGDSVSVIDGASNAVVATIPVGTRPFGVAVNATTNRIYVGNGDSSDVSVIDGASNAVIATISLPSSPAGLAVDPETNRIYVISIGFQGVTSVIDGATNTVIATVSTGSNAAEVAVNPATNRFYVTNTMVGAVDVFDTTDNGFITSVSVADRPAGTFGVAVNTEANRIYVTSFRPGVNNLAVIDSATNAVVATIAAGGGADVAVNSTTGRVYLANGPNNSVDVIQDRVAPPPVTVNARVSTEDDVRTVDISITNNTDGSVAHLEIRGVIPEGATFVDASPRQFQIIDNQVVWFNKENIGLDEVFGGFQYRFRGGVGNPIVTVDFIGQTRGSVSTGPVS